MVHNLKHIFLRVMYTLFFILGVSSLWQIKGEAFCVDSNNLTDLLTLYKKMPAKYYHPNTQGMCVAGDYIIETRWGSDSQETTYVVLDRKTGREVSHISKHTGHCNSLTYNPDKGEVACVSDGAIYLFRFRKGHLTYQQTRYSSYHLVKAAYVENEKLYYVSTGIRTFKTADFSNYTFCFETSEKGTNQGMASDGTNLFILWYGSSQNLIEVYSTSGDHLEDFTLDRGIVTEVEEIDFADGIMYVNATNSNPNGIYTVSEQHNYGAWITTKKPDCIHKGEKQRTCSRCGFTETKELDITNKHQYGKTITELPTCDTNGRTYKACKVCGKLHDVKIIPLLGHEYEPWETVQKENIYHMGIYRRSCMRCKKVEVHIVEQLTPELILNHRSIELHPFEKIQLKGQIQGGDKIISWSSDNTYIAKVENGTVTGRFPGTTTITVTTQSGIKKKCKVKIIIF